MTVTPQMKRPCFSAKPNAATDVDAGTDMKSNETPTQLGGMQGVESDTGTRIIPANLHGRRGDNGRIKRNPSNA